MKELEKLAERINEKTNTLAIEKNRIQHGIDPITIIMIVGIIINVIKVIQECRKNNTKTFSSQETLDYITTDIKFRSLNHSWFTRWKLRKEIKKQLKKEQYDIYGKFLLKAILEEGSSINQKAVQEAIEGK
jgi:hypothetical protein